MALINQNGMYNGSVSLNPLPYLNIAIQARNRKDARDEALDKYYRQLPDTINDKNLRDQEVPIINDYKNKIFEFGLRNREALRNPKVDNGAAKFNLEKLMREAAGVARLSQNAAKVDLMAGKSLMNKDNQYILNSDEYMADHDLHNLPVTDPNHKTLDLTKYAANRPFDQAALIRRNADIKYSDGVPEITDHPTDKFSQVLTTRPVLDAENKQVLFARAADDLHNNPMFAKKIKNELATSGQLPELVKIAQEQFGVKNPMDITDEHLAAAYEYSLLPVKQTTQKRIDDKAALMGEKNKEWDRRNKITFGQSMAKIAANKSAGTPAPDTGYISDEVNDSNGETITIPEKKSWTGTVTPARTVRVVRVKNIDPERLNLIIGKNLTKKQFGVEPIEMKMPDGSMEKVYEVDETTGDWVGKGNQTISREAAKDRYVNANSSTAFKTKVNTKASENTKNKKSETKVKIVAKKGDLDDL